MVLFLPYLLQQQLLLLLDCYYFTNDDDLRLCRWRRHQTNKFNIKASDNSNSNIITTITTNAGYDEYTGGDDDNHNSEKDNNIKQFDRWYFLKKSWTHHTSLPHSFQCSWTFFDLRPFVSHNSLKIPEKSVRTRNIC